MRDLPIERPLPTQKKINTETAHACSKFLNGIRIHDPRVRAVKYKALQYAVMGMYRPNDLHGAQSFLRSCQSYQLLEKFPTL
jgi:hypothetical protein